MANDFIYNRRRFLQQTLGTGLWATAATSGLIAPLVHAFGQVPDTLPPGRSIYELKGEVTVDGKLATINTIITAKSVVKTGSNSFIIFAVGKDSHILRENSTLELEGSGMVESLMRLVTGKVLSVFGEREKDSQYKIQTSTATIGIRGTGVYSESEKDVSYVCTCYGKVEIASLHDTQSKEEVISFHHDAPRYIYADGHQGKLIEKAPVKNHTDEELMLIEAIVGRTPPFSSIRGYSKPRRGY